MAYKLYFRGDLSPGVTREEAAERIGKLFRQPAETIEERLFSGRLISIKTVDTKEEAQRLVAAFAKAGAKLEVRKMKDEPANEAEPVSPPATQQKSKAGPRYGILAGMTLAIAAVIVAAWYTAPIWKNNPASDEQVAASRALATEDLIALGHLDIERTTELHARLFGTPDPDALLAGEDNVWDSLVAAGIDPGAFADDVIVALYAGANGPSWAIAIPGRPDADAVRRWIDSRYSIDDYDEATDTFYFSWLDERTCEAVPTKAARVGQERVLIADAARIDSIWTRLESSVTAEVDIVEWLGMTERQVLTIGVFTPAMIGRAADGMAGMMLAAAGQAAEPADALYFGVAPTMMPPGVIISGSISSNDQPFLEQTHASASTWLDAAKTNVATINPDLVGLYDRMSFSLDNRTFSAGVQLDTDLDNELQRLFSALFRDVFQAGPMQASAGALPVDEKIDENPRRFADTSADQLQSYASFGDGFIEPQWQQGPFALAVSKLELNDDGNLQVSLRGEGRGLVNLGDRSKLVRMQVTDVTDGAGQSLLAKRECGPVKNRGWADAGFVSEGSHFAGSDLIRFPTIALEKELSLREGVAAATVSAIRGEIEYQLPVTVRSVVVDVPLEGKVVEGNDVRVRFQAGSERTISYQASGDTRRLLSVRALNAKRQPLTNGGSTWGENWLAGGEHASVDVNGVLAAVEVVLAEELEQLSYSFELPDAFPANRVDKARKRPPVEAATPDKLSAALNLAAPEVTFPYSEPIATVVAGPGLLAVDRLQASSFMGLVAQLDLYVSNEMPLAGQLNGSSIVFDKAELADGREIDLKLSSPVSLAYDGAYWLNGEFTTDPEKPWLKGRATLQMADYVGDTPETIDGRIVFRAARETNTSSMFVVPGSRFSDHGINATIAEWRQNGLSLDISNGAERILSIEAFDGAGQLVGRAARIDGSGPESTARVELDGRPETLRIFFATELIEHEVPFSVGTAP